MHCKLIVSGNQCPNEAHQLCSNCKRDICLDHLQFYGILHGHGAMIPSCIECDLASIQSKGNRNRRQKENGLKETDHIPLKIDPA